LREAQRARGRSSAQCCCRSIVCGSCGHACAIIVGAQARRSSSLSCPT
jgi:hypothetical protein